jgi:hypothetical protein
MHSRNPQLRVLVAAARSEGWPWVSAHVPREANVDADRLSHTDLLQEVRSDAEAAGLQVTELELNESDWQLLSEAILASAHSSGRRKKRKRTTPAS